MKAWVLNNINDIGYREMERPKLNEDEVLVEVKAAGICGSDIPRIYENGSHKMPLILGHEFSGKVVEVGHKSQVGLLEKHVGIFPLIPCKSCPQCLDKSYELCKSYNYLGSRCHGGFTEYVAVPVWNVIELYEHVPYEVSAMMEPMAVAVHAIRRIKLKSKDRIAVIGLGTIGLLITMFLKEMGYHNLYVIGNKEMQKEAVLRLGLDETSYMDMRTSDVKALIMEATDGQGVNGIFECVGKNDTITQAIDIAAASGEICMVGNPYTDVTMERDIFWKILRSQLRITGTWNSSYGATLEEEEVSNMVDDWNYVRKCLKENRIHPEKLITHRFEAKDLEKGFHIMKNKSEDYIKIMMVRD